MSQLVYTQVLTQTSGPLITLTGIDTATINQALKTA